ncbi:FtsX-like permease family protein [Lacisediminihabitans changchengi]|uniref:FtsX-like permease family protein n=1 Tax=Lacisediminihabitans changchengi TaxID=2787634 RepID=A0A934SSQ9_9MICO|nr:FtsX-like permease family protein [Lacisediminihabitans changchengi]MBK4348308.1 FtsX-like permease family protein [Lacisediminihabitans changchengi]
MTRYRLPRLLLRQLRADATAHVALACVVLLLSGLIAALPLAVRSLQSEEIGYRLSRLDLGLRDVTSATDDLPAIDVDGRTTSAVFSPTTDGLAALRKAQPQPLRSRLGTAQYLTLTDPAFANTPPRTSDPTLQLRFLIAPDLARRVTVAAGSAPTAFDSIGAGGPPVQVMMTKANAESVRWAIGETRSITLGLAQAVPVQLSGTFTARDPRDRYWSLDASALTPERKTVVTGSEVQKFRVSSVVIDAASWPALADSFQTATTLVRYPTSAAALAPSDAERLLPQLRRFTATTQTVVDPTQTTRRSLTSISFRAPQTDVFALAVDRNRSATAVVILVVVGPLGVAVAVIWLLARLIVLRRRDALQLLKARGASATQLTLALAAETLALTLPAAAIGAAGAFLILGFRADALPGPILLGLVPGAVMAIASVTGRIGRRGRSDLGARSPRLGRLIGEVLVLALTVVAVILLRQRGFSTASGRGFDPLLAAVPLLLSISAAVLVLRVYPLPLLTLQRRLTRDRGLVGHLGATRAVRDPAAGLAPVLAMVVGFAVAVFSGVLVGTLQTGVEVAAQSAVGADLRVTGVQLADADLTKLRAVDGVADAAGIYAVSNPTDAYVGDSTVSVTVIVTDAARLSSVQRDLAQPLPLTGLAATGGALPLLIAASPDLSDAMREPVSLGDTRVRAIAALRTTALTADENWVLVDRPRAADLGVTLFRPEVALVRVDAGADPQAVARGIRSSLGADARVSTPDEQAQQYRSSPASSGLQALLIAIIAVVGLLCAAAVVLALLIAAKPRERLLALLRTLGMSRRQSRGTIAWEVAPSAVAALAAGASLGLVLPLITLAGVDLRPFTGGLEQPTQSIDPVPLLLLVGGFIVVVVGAAGVAIAVGRRANIARTLRTSGEG